MKVFIDIFIGVWAFVLGYIWTNHIDTRPADKAQAARDLAALPEVHPRLRHHLRRSGSISRSATPPTIAEGPGRDRRGQHLPGHLLHPDVLLDRRAVELQKLWQEGIGKLAAVYFVSLFGFVIWVGLLISWLFFGGVKPPLAS